ncbi:MAG: glycosyltransferase family 9 protein [Longimicrobiales bacterium]
MSIWAEGAHPETNPAPGHIVPGHGWQGQPPKEICIVMLSAIGDAVHVLPVATALKRAWPKTRITWVIQPVPWLMVRDHPAIDDFIIFRRRRGLRAWVGFRELMREMRGRQFDLLIGLQVYFKAGLITALTPARVKLGFDRMRARDAQWLFTNERIPARGQRHVQDQYLEFLDYLGVDPHPADWGLTFSDDERRLQTEYFDQLERPVCAVVVGTSKLEKNWNAKGYARVLEAIEREHGLQPVIVGGPSPVERAIADEILEETAAHVIDELGDDLRRLMWIVAGSALVISPDTGPLHIARALGTPCVSLFGYTNPKRSGPWQAYEDLVVDGYAKYPGEEYPIMPAYRSGMSRIGVDDVLEKVALAMESYVTL